MKKVNLGEYAEFVDLMRRISKEINFDMHTLLSIDGEDKSIETDGETFYLCHNKDKNITIRLAVCEEVGESYIMTYRGEEIFMDLVFTKPKKFFRIGTDTADDIVSLIKVCAILHNQCKEKSKHENR